MNSSSANIPGLSKGQSDKMTYRTNKNEQVLDEAHLKNSMRHQGGGGVGSPSYSPGSLGPGLPRSSEKPSTEHVGEI
jgi:hypothetical protein